MCPWHDRLFDPIAFLELFSQEVQEAGSNYLLLNMNKNDFTISQKRLMKILPCECDSLGMVVSLPLKNIL
jgi:hypothetical protein